MSEEVKLKGTVEVYCVGTFASVDWYWRIEVLGVRVIPREPAKYETEAGAREAMFSVCKQLGWTIV